MAISIEIWGDYACFSRPEMSVERVSYDVITPSAARGILEAIYWHPGIKWVIDKIHICNPIKFTTIKRNEVADVISKTEVLSAMRNNNPNIYLATPTCIQQRTSLILKDVRYIVDAHFEFTDEYENERDEGKVLAIVTRRIEKGQFWSQPYFGCREFPVSFSPAKNYTVPETLLGETDMGWMILDHDFSDKANVKTKFFRAKCKNGIIVIPHPDSKEVIVS